MEGGRCYSKSITFGLGIRTVNIINSVKMAPLRILIAEVISTGHPIRIGWQLCVRSRKRHILLMLLSHLQRINYSPNCIPSAILNREIEWRNNAQSCLTLAKGKKFKSIRDYLTIRGELIAYAGPRIHGSLPLIITSGDIRCLE